MASITYVLAIIITNIIIIIIIIKMLGKGKNLKSRGDSEFNLDMRSPPMERASGERTRQLAIPI